MKALDEQGFTNLTGVDTSLGMISRPTLHATMHFAVLDTPSKLAHPDANLDVVSSSPC